MAAKLHNQLDGIWAYRCPGCQCAHTIQTDPDTARPLENGHIPLWTVSGTVECPTIKPSVNYVGACHHYITDGRIEFLPDCTHKLAGQTVELPDWDSNAF